MSRYGKNQILKIRNLIKDCKEEEEIVLQDFISILSEVSKNCTKLEVENNKKIIVDLRRNLRDLKKVLILFKNRIDTEVYADVMHWDELREKEAPRGKNIQQILKEKKELADMKKEENTSNIIKDNKLNFLTK